MSGRNVAMREELAGHFFQPGKTGFAFSVICALLFLLPNASPASARPIKRTAEMVSTERSIILGRVTTYCEYSAYREPTPAGLRACISDQLASSTKLGTLGFSARDAISTCRGYVTGLRMLGSDEFVDTTDILACVNFSQRDAAFSQCVMNVTGSAYQANIFWKSDEAEAIESCFSGKIAHLRAPRVRYFSWENGKALAPYSTTARDITGSVRITKTTINFSGVSVPIQYIGPLNGQFGFDPDRSIEGGLYHLGRDPGALMFGNKLCGDDATATFVVISLSNAGWSNREKILIVDAFDQTADPAAPGEQGYCGGFGYEMPPTR